jgi:hypothetical protein
MSQQKEYSNKLQKNTTYTRMKSTNVKEKWKSKWMLCCENTSLTPKLTKDPMKLKSNSWRLFCGTWWVNC